METTTGTTITTTTTTTVTKTTTTTTKTTIPVDGDVVANDHVSSNNLPSMESAWNCLRLALGDHNAIVFRKPESSSLREERRGERVGGRGGRGGGGTRKMVALFWNPYDDDQDDSSFAYGNQVKNHRKLNRHRCFKLDIATGEWTESYVNGPCPDRVIACRQLGDRVFVTCTWPVQMHTGKKENRDSHLHFVLSFNLAFF